MNSLTRQKIFLLSGITIISIWRITSGEWDIPLHEVIHYLSPLLSKSELNSPQAIVIRSVRLPRLLCSLGTGGLLAVSGAVFQGILANPLAEPYTLGIASGAAFGAALGIMTGKFFVMPCAFAGAIISLMMTLIISRNGGSEKIILAGVISNAVLSSGVTFLKAIAGEKLSAVVMWLMGSLSGSGPSDSLMICIAAMGVLACAYVYAPIIDAMSLGKYYASTFGINEDRIRIFLMAIISLGVSVCVSSFGVIGFVGLAVPHISRKFSGAVHRKLVMHSFMTGAFLLSLADGVAQMMGELPVGVITALTGGIFFCRVLARK